jgi:four helix bundle protein
MNASFDFENLQIYKKSMGFINRAYEITRDFPREEAFGLTSQFRRAALSIALNVAEGSGRLKELDKRRFYEIARASVFECVPIMEVSKTQGYINEGDRKELYEICSELGRMLTGLMKSTLNKKGF